MRPTHFSIFCLGGLFALATSSFAAFAADEAETKFRAKHNLEPTVVIKFLDEKSTEISLAEFSRRHEGGAEFVKIKTTDPKGEDLRTFQLRLPLSAEQVANARQEAQARKAKMQLQVGKPLAAFKLFDVNGKPVSNEDLLGRPTLINFYFAECLPCILETPMLNEYLGLRTDLRMLAVTFDDQTTIEKYNRKHKFAWQSLVSARSLIKQIGVQAYPSFLLVDEAGIVRAIASSSEFPKSAGQSKLDSSKRESLDNWVNAALLANPNK
jgi:peroxiredoxin